MLVYLNIKNWKHVENIISACEKISNAKPQAFQAYKTDYICISSIFREKRLSYLVADIYILF